MAANRNDRKEGGGREFVPLLVPGKDEKDAKFINYEPNCDDEDCESGDIPDSVLFLRQDRSTTSLLANDSVLLFLDFLQIFALLQSLSLRWPWPPDWVYGFNFLMLFNLDIWDFAKVATSGSYKSVKDVYTPSDTVPFPFWSLMIAWGLLILFLGISYVTAYILLHKKNSPFLLVQLSHMKRAYLIIIQVLALPVGTTLAKVFHCNGDGKVDVDNALSCGDAVHIGAYILPTLIFGGFFFIVPTVLMAKLTRRETLRMGTKKHEQYLQLKELEYNHRMDMLWVIAHYHIFSSFKKYGSQYRAFLHIWKLVLLIFYAALFNYTMVQAAMMTTILFMTMIICCVIRPFRVKAFNIMLLMTYLCLSASALMGCLIASYNPYNVQSAWFVPDYSYWVLVFLASVWLLSAVIFVLYIVLRHHGLCICCKRRHLWPTLTSEGLAKLGPYTKKYLKAMLRSRRILEKTLTLPPIFAPVHDLVREIRIINAYTREAEYLKDPIHDSLLDVLDELIDCHGQLAPRSLFAASVKDSIRQTSATFMDMMPKFVECLAQREYDFLLMRPVKRRMLLKMYCMGVFLNGRADKVKKKMELLPAIEKVWMKKESDTNSTIGKEYYQEMYPAPILPSFQPYDINKSEDILLTDDEDDQYLAMLDAWAAKNTVSNQDKLNGSLVNLLEEWKDVQTMELNDGRILLEPTAGTSTSIELISEFKSEDTTQGSDNLAFISDDGKVAAGDGRIKDNGEQITGHTEDGQPIPGQIEQSKPSLSRSPSKKDLGKTGRSKLKQSVTESSKEDSKFSASSRRSSSVKKESGEESSRRKSSSSERKKSTSEQKRSTSSERKKITSEQKRSTSSERKKSTSSERRKSSSGTEKSRKMSKNSNNINV